MNIYLNDNSAGNKYHLVLLLCYENKGRRGRLEEALQGS